MQNLLIVDLCAFFGASNHASTNGANGLHVLEADVGGEDKLPSVIIVLVAQLEAQIQFRQSACKKVREFGEITRVFRGLPHKEMQCLHITTDIGGHARVGLDVAAVAREQIAAQTAFKIEHRTQQSLDAYARVMRLLQTLSRRMRTDVAQLVDTDKYQDGQQAKQHVDGDAR